MTTQAKARPLFDPAIVGQAVIDSFRKLTPQREIRNPVMFVVYVGSSSRRSSSSRPCSARARRRRGSSWLCRCGSGSRCCSPTSPRRWPRAGARPRRTPSGRPAATSRPSASATPRTTSEFTVVAGAELAQGRRRPGRGRRHHPGRRRGDRGHRLGGRERHHRRERPGDPRERRRPERRDRRHAGALRLAGRPRHGQSRRDLPGPHDRAWSKGPSGRRRPTKSP